jgi:hypothetical protein
LGAPGGPEYFDSKPEQIIVTAEMVIDVKRRKCKYSFISV